MSAIPSPVALAEIEKLATPTGKTVNRAPRWANGALVYRVATTDDPDVLRFMEEGIGITRNLLDGSVRQIPIVNGLIGHDHPGAWNWDGGWPYLGRVTFRARDWGTLRGFMERIRDKSNALGSFHVNVTDVNAGLADYPETREFFKRLSETGSMYRRDGRRTWPHEYEYPAPGEEGPSDMPYVPQGFPESTAGEIEIIAIVDYKKFWESGLAREMFEEFYGWLPYPPPILYLDVLTLSGSNFSTGFPDGALGGSERTQSEGVLAIGEYLHEKGTDIATEGDRPEAGPRGTYSWLHCKPGYSADDYGFIKGATSCTPLLHVAGNTGCFAASPVASTATGLRHVREHYSRLLDGLTGSKPMPGLETCHIAYPVSSRHPLEAPGLLNKWRDPFNGVEIKARAEFDIPGGGDPFRGDWADLINNFYLTGIQELYHIGKGNVRTAVFNKCGQMHITKLGLIDSGGRETVLRGSELARASEVEAIKNAGRLVIGQPAEVRLGTVPAGNYRLKIYGNIPDGGDASLGIYLNDELQRTFHGISFSSRENWEQEFLAGEFSLDSGANCIGLDAGPIYMRWSDGTTALWTTPFLRIGFSAFKGDVTFADDYDRMWPDTWSGQKKIYFFSWDGTTRAWRLPEEWADVKNATLYPLTPEGRGKGVSLAVDDRSVAPKLLPQVPHVLVPRGT